MEFIDKTKDNNWALGINSFYHFHPQKQQLYRINSTPISVSSIYSLDQNRAVLASNGHSEHHFYNATTNQSKKIKVSDFIDIPPLTDLKTIRFENGEYGCFHAQVDAVTYKLKGKKLKIDKIEKSSKQNLKLTVKLNQQFDLDELNELIDLIKKGESNYLKNHILEEMNLQDHLLPANEVDSVTSLLAKLNNDGIDSTFFIPYHSGSTSWGEKKVTLQYKNDHIITILSNNRTKNNIDLDWIIDVNGLKYCFKGLALWKYFYSALYPQQYKQQEKSLAKYLYQDFSSNDNQ